MILLADDTTFVYNEILTIKICYKLYSNRTLMFFFQELYLKIDCKFIL